MPDVIYSPNANIQTDYTNVTDVYPLGSQWRGRQVSDLYDSACGDMRVLVKGVFEIVSTAATAGEAWTLTFDGVQIPFTTAATEALTAAAIETALDGVFGAGKALETQVESYEVDDDTLTINFPDGKSHNIALVPPGGAASTFTADWTESGTPSAPVDHEPGYWVVLDPSYYDPQLVRVKEPASTTEIPYGIVMLEGAVPRDDGQTPRRLRAYWPAGSAMSVARRMQIMGRASGTITAADVGKPVYVVATGQRKGWSTLTDGGTSQITTGTVVANNGDTVGVTIDALPSVTVTSTASASGTATLLVAAINDRGDILNVLKSPATTDGADIILPFKGYATHTVVEVSPATAGVTGLETPSTPAVAATAIPTRGSTFMQPAADGEAVAINVFEG